MSIISTMKVATRIANISQISVRHGGHGPRMRIQPSTYMWSNFKNHLHFYVLLGVVPLTILTTYVNIFVGQAELREIPEGYTPHYYEYFKSPISRWIAKNLLYDKARDYETLVSKLNEESEAIILKKIERELRATMSEKMDNKSWYYSPVDINQQMHYKNFTKNKQVINDGQRDSGDLPR